MKKKTLFRIILFFIPVIILLILEAFLRLSGYGDDLDIVAKVERNGKDFYTMNQMSGKKYFNKDRLYYRKGSHDFFEAEKQPNTIRIFCFGASTTAGFPYEYNAIPTEFLRERLVNAFPDKNVEVINTAIAATNSFTVMEFADELTEYKPDFYIIYMGQNEFYGVFGAASTISIGNNRGIIKTYIWLHNFKTFLLIKDIIASIKGLFNSEDDGQEVLLMEQLAGDNIIEYNSSIFETGMETFRKNYEDIISSAKDNNIPVIVSTLVTNEKDLPPFVSINSGSVTEEDIKQSSSFLKLGKNAEKTGDFSGAINYYKKSIAIDSSFAETHYRLAVCYEKTGQLNEAGKHFILAKDLDALRFRAPSGFNKIIKEISEKYDTPLADVEKDFRENSSYRIIGDELLIDHLHPNISGYFLMAKGWFYAIKDYSEKSGINLSKNLTLNDSILWRQSPVTQLDSIIGELKILKLKNEPPFSKEKSEFSFTPENNIEQIAYDYVIENKMSWGSAHLTAAEAYLNEKNYEKALKEYKAILITDENNPYILSLIGDIYFEQQLYNDAEKSYMKAVSLIEDPAVKMKLGITSVILKKPETAMQLLTNCLMDRNIRRFNSQEIEKIHYNLALAYMQLNQTANAVGELNLVLEINPANKEAKKLLSNLTKNRR